MTTTPTLRDALELANIALRGDVPSTGGHTMTMVSHDALQALVNAALAAPADAPPTWPKDAAEVRAFMGVNFEVMKFGSEDQTPHDDDRYQLTAHDFLSAVNWWADFPHAQPAADALAEPVAWMDDGSTRNGSEGRDFRVVAARTKADMPRAAALPYTTPLYTAPPATQIQQAVARAIAECAVACDEQKAASEAAANRSKRNAEKSLYQFAAQTASRLAAAIRAKGKQ